MLQWAVQEGTGPAPGSLSGFVTQQGLPAPNTMVTLNGVDNNGNSIQLFAMTDSNGFYLFDNLAPGTYTVSIVPPLGYTDTTSVGTLGGTGAPTSISLIPLLAGQNGYYYDFMEVKGGTTGA